ncbi:phage tail protein [Clostridium saccharoperbutylacetonicum]
MDFFIGTILPWSMAWAPYGWLLCNGQQVPINSYQPLYALIGTTFGGDGKTYFNLPDLQGRYPVGMGQSPIPGVAACVLGAKHDSNGQVTLMPNNLPPHTHMITNTVNSSGGSAQVNLPINIPVNADTTAVLTNVPTNNMLAQGKAGSSTPANIYTSSNPATNVTLKSFNAQGTVNIPNPTVTVTSSCSAAGGATNVSAFDIAPNSLCINYIIAWNGIFPTKP